MFDANESMAEILLGVHSGLAFNVLDIGARPLDKDETFYRLLDLFPGSRIIAFEVEKELCETLNKTARPGLEYHAVALAGAEEQRRFFETRDPMCSSLYEPDQEFIALYHGLEGVSLNRINDMETVRLDMFASDRGVTDFDFLKIDVQGAELDVFRGATNSLNGIVALISEVEFIRIYRNQPLFGDVCDFLAGHGIGFHKFLGFAGRVLKPFDIARCENIMPNHMWADAFFVRTLNLIPELPTEKLLKLAFMAFFYGSPDLAQLCLTRHDERTGFETLNAYIELLGRLDIR